MCVHISQTNNSWQSAGYVKVAFHGLPGDVSAHPIAAMTLSFARLQSGESHRPLTPIFEKYRDTPPISIAIFFKNMPSHRQTFARK